MHIDSCFGVSSNAGISVFNRLHPLHNTLGARAGLYRAGLRFYAMAAQALDQFTGNPSGHRPLAPRPPGGSFPSDTLADTIETGGGAVNERDQGSRRPTKRTRVACQHCRQSKVRIITSQLHVEDHLRAFPAAQIKSLSDI